MALLDPCVALPFDPKGGNDNRESEHNEDQPLTPTHNLTATIASNNNNETSAITETLPPSQSSPSSQSLSTTPSSPSSNITTPNSFQPANLPTVLQSVFSYIFNDHSNSANNNNNSNLRVSGPPHTPVQSQSNPPTTPQTLQPLSTPSTPITNAQLLTPTLHINPLTLTPTTHSNYSPSSPLSAQKSNLSFPSVPNSSNSPGYCAILDLDETLLHSFFPDKVTPYQYQYMVMLAKQQGQSEANGTLSPDERTLYEVDVGDGTLVVLQLRPYLREFLSELFANYEVGVWSAGGKLYVDAICRVLFPHNGKHRPLFQLCWDDVQVETSGLSSYTKPLTTLTSRFAHFSLSQLFLVDNRRENGLHFPSQLVQAPDYLPRPWEWAGHSDRDNYLNDEALSDIRECVKVMQQEEENEREIQFNETQESDEENSQTMIDVSMRQENNEIDCEMRQQQQEEDEEENFNENENNESDEETHQHNNNGKISSENTEFSEGDDDDSASLTKRFRSTQRFTPRSH